MRLLITLLICTMLILTSCSNQANNSKSDNTSTKENVLDMVQVDSPNSFLPLGIGITVAPPEHGQNAKYFIINNYQQ